MFVAGVDVGSVGSKAVIFNGKICGHAVVPTGWSPKEAGKNVLLKAAGAAGIEFSSIRYIVGTGYGRNTLDFAQKTVTEITCHGKGVQYLLLNCNSKLN